MGGGIDNIVEELRSLKELAINAANDTNTDEDRQTIQKEFIQRMDTINDIATTTAYNGKTLIDGTHARNSIVTTSQLTEPTGTPILISAGDYTITEDGIYSLADGYTGTITVNARNVKLTQQTPATQLSNVSIVTSSGGSSNLWIENLNIKNTEDKNIIKFQGADNYLTVKGTNILDDNDTSIHTNSSAVNVGDGLTIIGGGSLEASSYNGAGIGGDHEDTAGYIKIGGAVTITATSRYGAGIGSGGYLGASAGDILIGGNATITATSYTGAGIGGGYSGTVGNISISGNVTITATSTNAGAGIGSGYLANAGDILIGGSATITATGTGGAGIGSGDHNSSVGDILIGGNVTITATSPIDGAGIGSGTGNSSAGDILIGGNANISAISKVGAGIGSGAHNSSAGDITISTAVTFNATSIYGDNVGKGYDNSTVGTISIGQTNFDIDVNVDIDWQDETIKTSSLAIGNALRIQSGDSADHAMNIFIEDMHTKSLGAGKLLDGAKPINSNDKARYEALSHDRAKQMEWLTTLRAAENLTLDDISVMTRENANIAIRVLDGALEYALDQATTIGAYLQRLEYTATNITTSNENVQAAESTIRDADMARTITDYTKHNVLTQAAQSMLAQANQNATAALGLLI